MTLLLSYDTNVMNVTEKSFLNHPIIHVTSLGLCVNLTGLVLGSVLGPFVMSIISCRLVSRNLGSFIHVCNSSYYNFLFPNKRRDYFVTFVSPFLPVLQIVQDKDMIQLFDTCVTSFIRRNHLLYILAVRNRIVTKQDLT